MAKYSSPFAEELLASLPINYNDPKFKLLLNDLQANILAHHKKKYASHLFLTFNDISKARYIIKIFASNITSAYEQFHNKHLGKSKTIYSFYLSGAGYNFLKLNYLAPKTSSSFFRGIDEDTIKGFEQKNSDNVFKNAKDIHAMVLVASDIKSHLEKKTNELINLFEADETANVELQRGFIMFDNDKKTSREWFGFVDGISQPRFFPSIHSIESNTILKSQDIDQLNLLLTEDPGGSVFENDTSSGQNSKVRVSFGSYLAVLKLEQNKDAFDKLVEKRTKEYGNAETAKASIMGRFTNGKPLTLHHSNDKDSGILNFENNFDYTALKRDGDELKTDDEGKRCPFTAHIRKVNPRRISTDYNKRKIARRGVLYVDGANSFDEMRQEAVADKNKRVGTLFMSFQNSLEEQFEYIVKNWMHGNWNLERTQFIEKDIVTGKKAPESEIDSLVTYKGGLYLFAPSRSFLNNIDNHFPPLKLNIKSGNGLPTNLFTAEGGVKMGVIRLADEAIDKKIDAIIATAYPKN
ncbi:MAG: hypothetical protein GC192_05905 [Bacteroidetes bacterium]|nr:hypothetical protein [Bacteroidota bacterium]